jgi:cytochrome o ubiquinol oxidase subunit IV
MSEHSDYDAGSYVGADQVPGEPAAEERTLKEEVRGYVLGLVIALGLTAASFWAVGAHEIYRQGAAVALLVLAVAQMGIHLVFFLHITTSPDNANNVLALAFGVLIVCLVVFGSLWVMGHMNHNMVPMSQLMQMQR